VPQSTGEGGEVSDSSAVGASLEAPPHRPARRTSQPHVPQKTPTTARHRGRASHPPGLTVV